MQKILITGATGFLGYHTANKLSDSNDVFVIIRDEKKLNKDLRNKVNIIIGDLSDNNMVQKACKNIDIIVHCAAKSTDFGPYKEFYKDNVLATKNICQAAIKNNVKKLIHISTPSLYFHGDSKQLVTEDQRINEKKFINNYVKTKYLAEKEVNKANKDGLYTVILRPRAIFGPGDNTIIPSLIDANNQGKLPLINKGLSYTDVTYVDNVVDVIELAYTTGNINGKIYNVTNDNPIFIKDLYQKLFNALDIPIKTKKMPYHAMCIIATILETYGKITKKKPLVTKYSVSVLAKTQTLSIEKAKKELKYSPRISISQGLKKYKEWYKNENKDL